MGPTGRALWNGKAPEDFNRGRCVPLYGGNGGRFAKAVNCWAAGIDCEETIAQQLAEGRAQAARENAARPAPAKGKEARDDR